MMRTITKGQHENTKIRLVTFDWSGVISDDRPPVYESNMRMLEIHGKKRMTFQEWLPRTTMTPIEFMANQGINGNPEAVWSLYRETYSKVRTEGLHPTVYPDAKESLEKISKSGVPLIVISSHPEEHLEREATEYGLKGYFSSFLGSVKNKADGILRACLSVGREPSNTVYIGDTIYDIQAAKEAKAYSAGVASGYHVWERLLKENPDILVNTLTEFHTTIKGLLRVD